MRSKQKGRSRKLRRFLQSEERDGGVEGELQTDTDTSQILDSRFMVHSLQYTHLKDSQGEKGGLSSLEQFIETVWKLTLLSFLSPCWTRCLHCPGSWQVWTGNTGSGS